MSENVSTNQTPVVTPPENNAQEPKRNKYESRAEKRKLPKVVSIGLPIAIIALIVLGVASFVKSNTSTSGGDIIDATVTMGGLSTYVTGRGSISPVSKAEYGADIKGEILEVAVSGGDIVKVGDLLFTIDPTELKVDLLKAKEQLSDLEKQLLDLEKNYDNAREALADANKAYANSTTRAPFSGILLDVSSSLPNIGDTLTSGTKLATLADNSAMKLTLFFNRGYINDVKVGQTVTVSAPDSMAELTGTVTKINDLSRPIDGALCFSVEIKVANPGGLEDGQPATGYIHAASGSIMPSIEGTLEYWQKEEIVFDGVTAKLLSKNIQDYGAVSQGDALCSVDPGPGAEAVSDAQYTLDKYIRQMSDDYIQNDIIKAQEKIDELEEICETSAFYSTIDGQVTAVMIKPGDKLTASETAVLTVSDTSSLVINANIDESDISNVKVGMNVDITYDTTDGGGSAMGTITYLSYEAKTSSSDYGSAYAYFPATISLQNDGSLLPGMSVNYSILAVQKDFCLQLPSSCIINTEEGPVVYVKKGQAFEYEEVIFEGEVEIPEGYFPVRVEIGVADAYNTEIVSGVEEGTVVYQGTMQSGNSGYWY